MGINEVMLLSIIGIQILRTAVLYKWYGEKKGDFIAAILLLLTLPLIWLSNAGKGVGSFLKPALMLLVIFNLIRSTYNYKYKK